MDRILQLFATAWDRVQLAGRELPWMARRELVAIEPSDADCPYDLDVLEQIERCADAWRGRAQGVFSSSDYPGALAAAVLAERLGLPGARPANVVRCAHKHAARLAQHAAVPEATPPFQLVLPEHPEAVARGIGFPCFVKPVKGSFSMLARRVDDERELASFLASPAVREYRTGYLAIFDALVRRCTELELETDAFLAEGLLHGDQVTVEGYCLDGEVVILGTVDSVMYPGTRSFARFDYPSSHPADLVRRAETIARRALTHLPLERSLFNVELMLDASTGAAHIIEINPRMCAQFADLYEKVDGVNGYEIALDLATGRRPRRAQRAGSCAFASSFVLRTFEPARIARAPEPDEIRAVERAFPGARILSECQSGDEFTDFVLGEDGASARYAVINAGAPTRPELERLHERIRAVLDFRLEPLPQGFSPSSREPR